MLRGALPVLRRSPFARTRGRAWTAVLAVMAIVAATLVAGQAPRASADSCANPIVCENAKQGTPRSQWDLPDSSAGDPTIQGFSTSISTTPGGSIGFKVDAAAAFSIAIYRIGYYGGDGARLIGTVPSSATTATQQPACLWDVTVELTDCGNWSLSATWQVPSDAVSGVYVADLIRTDTGGFSQALFVVKDPTSTSDVLVKTDDSTWEAYNTFGGSDFYQGAANGRAFEVSYNRPLLTRSYSQSITSFWYSELPLIDFLEKNGYNVSYTTDVDTALDGAAAIEKHKVFVSSGHDEYWSTQERANVEAARDAGTNMQFLSGNEVFWHTTLAPSTDQGQAPDRTLVTYKDTWSNTWLNPGTTWTGTWRDPRFATKVQGGDDPENSLTGQLFMTQLSDDPVNVTADQGKFRLWANTGLNSMTGASTDVADHLIGYEADEDVDNGFRQSGLLWLSTTSYAAPQRYVDYGTNVAPGQSTNHMTLYRAASGALVMAAGSIQWNWGLSNTHDNGTQSADPRMQQFEVNMLADMGAQPGTLQPGLSPAAASTDTTPPVATVTSPAPGSTLANGSSVTVSGTASDVGGVVAAIEVSADGGATWHMANGTTSWSYTYVVHGIGSEPFEVRAVDDSANYAPTPVTANYTISGPYSTLGDITPVLADAGDTSANELGLKFTATQFGSILGVRFYKSAGNTGTHTGTLWDTNGNALATVTFSNETATGWQTADFATPVEVNAGQSYVISYTDPNGHYAADTGYFDYRGSSFGPMTLSGGPGNPAAGVYGLPGDYPSSTYQNSNYYVDAIFAPNSGPSTLTATGQWPAPGSSSVPRGTTISAVLSQDVPQNSIAFHVTDQLGNSVAGTTSYSSTTRTATFTPASELDGFVTYSVTLAATTSGGTALSSGATWSFETVKSDPVESVCPCGLFTDATTPTVLEAGDTAPVTLGLRFSPNEDGQVTGMRFYKAADNDDAHVGTLWAADGTVLATGTFTDESTSGWQTLTFTQPVDVTAGSSYVVGYRTTTGDYSLTPGGFGSGLTVGPLTAASDAGAYTYGDGVPSSSSTTSYLVDVIFTQPAPSFSVASESPAQGASDVDAGSTISVVLSSAVTSGYQVDVTSAGDVIAGSTSLSSDGKTITFTPSDPLPGGAEVDVSVTGLAAVNGLTLPKQSWSFVTAAPGAAPYSLFGSDTPTDTAVGADDVPLEVGTSFTPSTSGKVTAIKFYKSAGQTGTQTGHLWTSSGVLLATANFTGETASGWQTATLASPVVLTAGTTYVVSYFASQGGYSYTGGYFGSAHTSGVLTAGASNNGLYQYTTTGAFPIYSWNATNYFVDVNFVADQTGSGDPGSVPTDSPTPSPSGDGSQTIFGGASPSHVDNADGTPVQLGVKFSPSAAGTITAISYYRSPGDTSADVVNLWSSDGTLLGTANVPASTGPGWQEIALASPVQLTAGASYIASYYSPSQHYPYDAGGLASPVSSGDLTATSGEYVYGTGFPSNDSTANYWVDVHFIPSS